MCMYVKVITHQINAQLLCFILKHGNIIKTNTLKENRIVNLEFSMIIYPIILDEFNKLITNII